uniref:Ig-like domain-containing protein n=1 Tax=Heterorhabditis bacteriophora TaxID=37862 RepID=A0A1I7WVD7_HETBA
MEATKMANMVFTIIGSQTLRILIVTSSRFEVQPIDHTVARGQPVVFHCLMVDLHLIVHCLRNYVRPIATVVWYHNEQVISENGNNYFTSVYSRKYIIITDSIPTELIFLSAPRMNTVDEGEDILLECLATAKSRPEVRWLVSLLNLEIKINNIRACFRLKDTRQIAVDGIRIRHVGVSSLIITSASISDAGLYTCRASSVDDSLDRTVAVDVHSFLFSAPPHLTTRPQDKIALETADVEINNLDSSSVAASSGQPLVASAPLGLRTGSIGTIGKLYSLGFENYFLLLEHLLESTKQKRGYTAAKKSSSHQQSNDMWINHPTGSHVRGGVSDYTMEVIGATMTDMKHLSGPEVVESPPPRYQALQDSAYGSVSVRHSRTPIRQSVSSYEDGETRRPLIVGRAKPILASANSYGAGEENNDITEEYMYGLLNSGQGTLSRSYHHSSTSLEGRQRTPQVVYTGSGRHQVIPNIKVFDKI